MSVGETTPSSLFPQGMTQKNLLEIAKKSAGAFRNPKTRQTRPELAKVIIITVANGPYTNQVENLMCWLERLDMKILLF